MDAGQVAALVSRLFGVSCTLRGISYLLHRMGFSPQVPVHRAAERDEDAVAAWRSVTWAKVRGQRRRPGRGPALRRGRAGAAAAEGPHLGPPRAHPGDPGQRPGSGRISVAGLVCLKPGEPGRFFYRMRGHRLRSPGGNLGPGAFDNDDALDLLDTLTGQDAVSRRETLDRIFCTTREHPEDLNWTLGPAEVVAAAAAVAAGLPADEAVVREITGHHYQTAAPVISGSAPELAGAALAALLIAAGRDGAWHQGWADAETALQARRTTDQLASAFYRHQHRHDQELPLGF